ncbi:MAG: hypothetical protein FWD50_07420 [Betaproteobacteria bacterium]|nr:hypothetical protein [Betaproteobacteria bacterium]
MSISSIFLPLLITAGLLAYGYRRRRCHIETHRPSALDAFNSLSIHSSDPRFQFDGKTGQIVEEIEGVEESQGNFIAYTLTRIAKNSFGEYFWFYFRTDSPLLFKHIEQSRAKVLLKKKYLASQPAPIEIAPTI